MTELWKEQGSGWGRAYEMEGVFALGLGSKFEWSLEIRKESEA